MKLNKILLALTATLCVASAQASIIAFNPNPANNANVAQSSDVYWNMLNAVATTSASTAASFIGGFKLSNHGTFDYNPLVADFINAGAGTGGLNLAAGSLINSTSNWGSNGGFVGTTGSGAGCAMGNACIYGLKFKMAGNTHYGWIQFHEINRNRQQLLGWGYESVAGVGIGAGIMESLDEMESAPVPEPVSVALLGIGLAGLAASRRKRASKPA